MGAEKGSSGVHPKSPWVRAVGQPHSDIARLSIQALPSWDFPGCPWFGLWAFTTGAQVLSSVVELRSNKPHNTAKQTNTVPLACAERWCIANKCYRRKRQTSQYRAHCVRWGSRDVWDACKESDPGTSLVALWLKIHLVRQGMWVVSLVGELRSYMLGSN